MTGSVTRVVDLDISTWRPTVAPGDGERYARDLEAGGVLVLPKLAFEMTKD